MCEGIVRELEGIDLGDKRLDERSRKIMSKLFAQPGASVNASFEDYGETLAAYRFFQNARISPEKILEPHGRETLRRIGEEPVVLIVQDTTELDYTSHPAKDARHLNRESRFGFYDHTHLAFTPTGLCLGVLGVQFFDRSVETLGKSSERKTDPMETKESWRWFEGYEIAHEVQSQFPDKLVVSVADREGDLYDVYLKATQAPHAAAFVHRLKTPRKTYEKDPEAGPYAYLKVRKLVETSAVRTVRELELPRTPKREARTATLEIRAQTLTVQPPQGRKSLGALTMNFVSVIEINRPEDDPTVVNWFLGTSLPIDSTEDVVQVIDFYRGRWPIETFFRTLKSGCEVEKIQLEQADRLQRCLMFYKIIAWRILYLTFLGRECPDMPCDHVFAPEEWMPVWKIVKKEPPPKKPPKLNEFIRTLAALGGYNNRKNDPPPGAQVLWNALRRMLDFSIAWQAFGPG